MKTSCVIAPKLEKLGKKKVIQEAPQTVKLISTAKHAEHTNAELTLLNFPRKLRA